MALTARRVNLSRTERVLRVLMGVVLAVWGLVLLAGGAAIWGTAAAALLLAAGLDLAVTGARGYCPLYARLGYTPRSLRGSHR